MISRAKIFATLATLWNPIDLFNGGGIGHKMYSHKALQTATRYSRFGNTYRPKTPKTPVDFAAIQMAEAKRQRRAEKTQMQMNSTLDGYALYSRPLYAAKVQLLAGNKG